MFQKGLEAANLEGLETAAVLEATAGLEAEANLEVLESVGLEAAAAAILEDYLEADSGGGEGPGGGGQPGGNGGPAVGVPGGGQPGGLKESLGMKITAQGLTTPPPPPTPLIFPEKVYKSTADVIKVLQFRSADKGSHTISTASSWCRRSNLHLFEETKQLDD
ncbi:unnamed protein product [Boreogadus saida]